MVKQTLLENFMKKTIYVLGLALTVLLGCEDGDIEIKYEGEAVFTSERILSGGQYVASGFSFEKGENIPYTLTGSSIPDIIVSNETDVNNNILGAVLNSPGNEEAFRLYSSYPSTKEAESAFNEYVQVADTAFTSLALEINGNQLWTFQTSGRKYAKILVREMLIISDPTVSDYIEIKVSYKYQPDGSKQF